MKTINYILAAILVYAPAAYADAYIKLVSDQSESDVYVNGDIVGTYYDTPLEFILPPGEYNLEVKKAYKDQSTGYFSRQIKAGKFDAKIAVNAVLKKEYTQDWYYRRANTIKGARAYLEKFPRGKQSKAVRGFLEMAYAKAATTLEGAKEYLERYPQGRFKDGVLNRTIYLVSMKEEKQKGKTEVHRFTYDEKGNLIQENWIKPEGRWEKTWFTYTPKNQLIQKVFQRKGKPQFTHHYRYDGNGNRVEETIYRKDQLDTRILYTYDQQGRLVNELEKKYLAGRYLDRHSYETIYTWDENNNLKVEERNRVTGGDLKKYTYWYDDQGKMVKRRVQIANGYREMDKTYDYDHDEDEFARKYNDNGLLIEEIKNPRDPYPVKTLYTYREDLSLAEKNTYCSDGRRTRYLYDAHGNLVQKTSYRDSEGDVRQTRFEYTGFKVRQML
ncbi:MAG: PEGA domain-containing protein [Desulfobacter sp.]|nr:MAG: PEGA domain-containing protein [Desulfobacter sp.]